MNSKERIIQPLERNVAADTDFYKFTHPVQHRKDLTKMYTYGEGRTGGKYPYINFVGMTMMLVDHFLQKPTDQLIDEAHDVAMQMGGNREHHFDLKAWKKAKEIGYVPFRVRALPEGSVVPEGTGLFTCESTEDWFAKNVNSLETTMMNIWYPMGVATRCMNIYDSITPFFEKAGTDGGAEHSVLNFGARGNTDWMASYRSGVAHLVWFDGTDTVSGVRAMKNYYDLERGMSVWATEHSVATTFGPGEGEYNYIKHQLLNSDPTEILSIVTDTYDSDNFLTNVITRQDVRELIIARPGRTVFRLDSGVPKIMVNKSLEILRNGWGYTINPKTYKLLNHNIGLLQGDAMNEGTIPDLYHSIVQNQWSPDNLCTASGGGMIQEGLNRDMNRMAIKGSYAEFDHVGFNMQKKPASDPTKNSKCGLIKVQHTAEKYYTTIESSKCDPAQFNAYIDSMQTVLENGKMFNIPTGQEIIDRSHKQFLATKTLTK